MLAYHVEKLQTGVYIRAGKEEESTLSVSGSRQVTLHCAGDLTSDPFPFDAIVYAPFHNTLYSACVADNVRAQFGAALQRPAEAAGAADGRSAPRRCTIVHGDPVAHSTAAFHHVVRLAAEDVERIAGAHHAESPYECVFNVVRVYPWGETDLLREALRGEAEALPSLWREKTTVPLRTPAHRRLLMTALQDLCRLPAAGERDESAACVAQVRLAVYASGGAGARREKVLCAEHLFSLMPSVADVCRSFGTTMEALCEVLVCRREGNLLDNALLPMLLPAGVIDSLSVLTCVSAQGRYASRGCIDACCFGCSSDRECLVNPARKLQLEGDRAGPSQRVPHRARNLFLPPANPLHSHPFQQMTRELLLSVAPRSTDTTPQQTQTLSPAATLMSTTASPGHRTPSPLSRLDASVDRLLAHHHRSPISSPGVKATPSNRTPLQSRLPFSPYELRRQKGKAALHAETMLAEHVAEMEKRAEAAVQLARERTAEARRSEMAALDKSCEVEAQLAEMRHRYAAEEAALLIQQKVLELACAELEGRERELTAAVAAREGVAEGLQRAERQMAELEPRVREMRAAEQLASHCAELQQRHAAYVDGVCGAYGSAVAAKLALLDSHAHAVADGVRLDAWETRLTRLQHEWAAQEARVAALVALSRDEQHRVEELRGKESELCAELDGLRGECARLEAGVARLDAEREEKQRRIAADLSEAAAAQEKALQDYDASIAVLRRLKGEQQDLRTKRDALREECEKEKTLYDAAKMEVNDVRGALGQLRGEEEKLRNECEALKEEVEHLRTTAAAAGAANECAGTEEDAERDRASQETAAYDAARATVAEDLRALIEELADATEDLAEVEDGMIAETDKALLAFRRCDGELTLRIERLMDRCASFIDVESRITSRSMSHLSESTLLRRPRTTRGGFN